ALADLSERKSSISARLGGRPRRSKLRRRINVSREASGENFSPSRSNRPSTNASIGLRTSEASGGFGTGTSPTGINAQWGLYSAPWATQRRRTAFSFSLRLKLLDGGGIRSSSSVATMRRHSSLSSGLPGAIAALPESLSRKARAVSGKSRRSLAL